MSRACSIFALQCCFLLCLSLGLFIPWHKRALLSTFRFPLPSPPSRAAECCSRPRSKREKIIFSLPLQHPVLLSDPCLFFLLVAARCFPIISMSSGAVGNARPGPTRLAYLHLQKLGLWLPKRTYGAVGGGRLTRLSLQQSKRLRIAQTEKRLGCCFQMMEELVVAARMFHGTPFLRNCPDLLNFIKKDT